MSQNLMSPSLCQTAREACEFKHSDITVSCDSTWKRQVFASKNGVATVITQSWKTW